LKFQNRFAERFGKGDRWKSSKSELRYKTWRKNVFTLNKAKKGLQKYYVCEKCNKKLKTTRALHAHHRKSWDKFPKDRYSRDNGVVLCWKCHNTFHRKYKFEALTKPELLDEYLKKNS
jgi:5-methylcytosine-specific restriction endonuclease McrA